MHIDLIADHEDDRTELSMIGDHVAHYEIVEKIGEGGMGVVYRALDRKLRRNVALKILSTDAVVNERQRRRFLREARVGSALEHPGIVTVHDFLSHAGQDVIVMELVPGMSLRQRLADGALAWSTAVRYATGIADAVRAAHAVGIIHRDLKPENVMVTADERVKVFDFGIASLCRDSQILEGLTTLTSRDSPDRPFPGTLLYMSPEQTLGEPIDLRSDIFSFGVLLYEMLCGRRPFRGDTALAHLYQLHYAEPEPLELDPEVPTALAELVAACLEKQRQRRPSDMETVLARLASLRSPPSSDSPAATPPMTIAPKTTSRRWRRLAVPTLALLIVASGFLLWPQPRAWLRIGESEASLLPRQEASAMFVLYRQAWDDLHRFDRPGRLDRAIEAFERVVASGEMRAAAHAGLARAYWRRYRWQSFDRHWLDRATEVARRAVELNGDLAQARISLALTELENGRVNAARQELEHALRLDPQNSDAHFAEARLHLSIGDDKAAQAAFEKTAASGKDDRELFDLWGTLHYRQGRYNTAVAAFSKSIERAPDSTVGYRNLAAAYFKLERYGEAAAELQRALAIEPSTDLYANLGTLYFYQGLYSEAAVALERALLLPGGVNRYISWGNFADACRQVPGREQEARDAYLRALQLLDEKVDEGGRLTATEQSHRSLYLARRGEGVAALAALERLDAAARQQPEILYRQTLVQELAGYRERALESLARALESGYPLTEVQREPDLLKLRDDVRYHQIFIAMQKARQKARDHSD